MIISHYSEMNLRYFFIPKYKVLVIPYIIKIALWEVDNKIKRGILDNK